MSGNGRSGKGLAEVSHLFLSQPHPMIRNRASARDRHVSPSPASPIYVTSGSDLIARSLLSLNLAIELALRGRRTALVDADPDAPMIRYLAAGVLDERAGRSVLSLGGRQTLPLFDEAADAIAADRTWEQIVVNIPWWRLPGGSGEAPRVDRLLLVTSPLPHDCIRGFAAAERAARVNDRIRLGVVVCGAAGEGPSRSLYETLVAAIAPARPASVGFCGWIPEDEEMLRSVRSRVPAALSFESPALAARLRGIVGAVARLFFGP